MQQFKDKDWLRVIAGHERPINSVFQIKSCLTRYKLSDVELWQPKEGEWCWFWNGYSKYTLTLGRLAEYSKEEKLYFSYNGVVYMSYEYCEPFIGELPSFLKERDEKISN